MDEVGDRSPYSPMDIVITDKQSRTASIGRNWECSQDNFRKPQRLAQVLC